jgi:hypothetical protein
MHLHGNAHQVRLVGEHVNEARMRQLDKVLVVHPA